MKKKILIVLASALVVIQFFRPEKNVSAQSLGNEIGAQFNVAAETQSLLKTSCYDCHSNNTLYPWYSMLQPVSWWLASHIKNAKKELNFDEFAAYTPKKQYHKFEEMDEVVSEKEMPLSSYTLLHRNAALSAEQISLFVGWTKEMRKEMELKYGAESLISNDSEIHKD